MVGDRHRHGRLWPAAGDRDASSPTTSTRPSTSSSPTAARLRYRSAGEFTAPLTVRTPYGGGIFGGQTHSQSPEALFTHVCGHQDGDPVEPRTTPRAC